MSADVANQSAESGAWGGVSALLFQIPIFLIVVPATFSIESIKTDVKTHRPDISWQHFL